MSASARSSGTPGCRRCSPCTTPTATPSTSSRAERRASRARDRARGGRHDRGDTRADNQGRHAEDISIDRPLVARDFLDIHLSDALAGEAKGCLLCARRLEAGHEYLRLVLYEGVNDIGIRQELARSRGLCARHTTDLLEVDRTELGGVLGASILLEAVLGRRLKEIEALLADGGRGLEKAISAASAAPTCPACGVETESVSTAIERLVDRLSDEQWSAAIASAELCLPDLLSIWSVARRRKQSLEAWRPIARQHVARLDALRQQLEAFAHNSSHDRRHRIDEAQQESAAVATRVIAGAAAAQPSNRKSTRG